jgi:hypothetical protein
MTQEPSLRTAASAAAFHLLSHHGSLVVYDSANRQLRLARIGADPEPHLVRLQIAADAGAVLARFVVAEPRADSSGADIDVTVEFHATLPSGRMAVALRAHSAFVTADGGTGLHFGTAACDDWEIFLLVRADEIDTLREIARHPQPTDRRSISLVAGHRLRIGAQAFPLAAWNDIAPVLLDNLVAHPGHAPDHATVYRRRAPARHKRVWILPLGNSANRALQFLVADRLAAAVDGAQVDNIHLPEWSRVAHASHPPGGMSATLGMSQQRFDLPGLADCLDRGIIDTVLIKTFPFNLNLYPDLARCRSMLGPAQGTDGVAGFGAGELVCNIRGGEVLRGVHPDYIVLPPAYYRALAERTGLRLVFFGQIANDPYCAQLRAAFPDARFVAGTTPEADFETLRRSRHIAIAVSTFSWLAAWLSEAETIHVPIGGMFSPVQNPVQSYLAADDPRFHFTLLPYARMVDIFAAPAAFAEMQDRLARGMRPLTREATRELCRRAAIFAPHPALLRGFDPCHYLTHCPEAAAAFRDGTVDSPLQHYLDGGDSLRHRAIPFDEAAYLRDRPDAAIDVALGLFADPLHHYLAAPPQPPKPQPPKPQPPKPQPLLR